MTAVHSTDQHLTPKDIRGLASADAVAELFTGLGYDTDGRKPLTAAAIGVSGDSAARTRRR